MQNNRLTSISVFYLAAFFQGLCLVLIPASSFLLKSFEGNQITDQQYGIIFIPQIVAASFSSICFKKLIDKLGIEKIYNLGLLANIFNLIILLLLTQTIGMSQTSFAILLICNLFLGFGFGVLISSLNLMIVQIFDDKKDAALAGMHALLGVGAALSPILINRFIEQHLWFLSVVVYLVIGVILTTVSVVIRSANIKLTMPQVKQLYAGAPLSLEAKWFLFVILLYGIIEALVSNWSLIYLGSEKIFSMHTSSQALSIFWVSLTAGRLLASVLALRIKAEHLFVVSPVLISVALFLNYLNRSEIVVPVIYMVLGLGCSYFFPIAISLSTRRFGVWQEKLASWSVAALMLGVGVGSSVVGLLREAKLIEINHAFLFGSFLAIGIFILVFQITKKTVASIALFLILSAPITRLHAEEVSWWPSKYGENDQIGTLNEITPQKIVESSTLVKTGKTYDLGRVLHANVPHFEGRFWQQTLISSSHTINQRRPDFGGRGWGKNQINWITELVTGTFQIGTQLDSLNHLQIGDRFYNGLKASDIVEEWGTNKLGTETIPPIISRGVLIDLTEEQRGKRLAKGQVVTVAMINQFLKKHSLEIKPGDILLLHTGWGELWEKDNETFSSGEPGPGLEVAKWLIENRIAMAGCDTWSFGAVPGEDPERPFEVPQMLNVKNGFFIMENLKTEELAKDKVYQFQFILTHAKTKGSTAANISPVAVI